MSKIEESVIEKIRNRAIAGFNKYGKTMEREDLSIQDWILHAQEEAMDLCVYLEKLQQTLEANIPTLRTVTSQRDNLIEENKILKQLNRDLLKLLGGLTG